MSVKRRDSKNRVLRNGESQKPDGRYVYKYYDILRKPHYVYSWKLEPTDKLPAGKKNDLSLREKIRQIQKDMIDGIDVQGSEMTVLELVKRYIATKTGVKPTTEAGYKTVVHILEKEALDRNDLELIIDRIKIYEDHLDIQLKPDIDILLKCGLEGLAANFKSGIEDISLTR